MFGPRGAAEFQAALISDTLQKVNRLSREVLRYFFTSGRGSAVASSLSDYVVLSQHGANLGERLERAFARLLARHGRAIIIGTDSPTLVPQILRQALGELHICDAVVGPCPDGGFYLIGLRRFGKGTFRGVRWESAYAFRDTLRNLLRENFSCAVLEPCADVDRPSDVERLMRQLSSSRPARCLAPCVWRFLKDFYAL